jgi:probable rRNA maturation factor
LKSAFACSAKVPLYHQYAKKDGTRIENFTILLHAVNSNGNMAVHFVVHEVKVKLENKTRLKTFLKELFAREGQGLKHLQYVFCSDDYLLEINKQFLQHDTFTDIVTFELSEVPRETSGEIYISVDRVVENAKKFNTAINHELHRVIFHGALYLCGYKDKSKKEASLMREKENEYLDLYFKGQ